MCKRMKIMEMLIHFSIANWAWPWFGHGFGFCQPSHEYLVFCPCWSYLLEFESVIHWGQTRGHVLLMGMACDVRQVWFPSKCTVRLQSFTPSAQCGWPAASWEAGYSSHTHTHIITRPRQAGDVTQVLREKVVFLCYVVHQRLPPDMKAQYVHRVVLYWLTQRLCVPQEDCFVRPDRQASRQAESCQYG